MLQHAENELLCRVESGAAMGSLIARYWIPAVLSEDLKVDGAPRQVRLLGNSYVAFRDSKGEAGLLDENCPHRGASLVLARNENCALQCLYHGWRVDRTGKILDTPTEPGDSRFKERIRHVAYPCVEAGGVLWVYLGPEGRIPPVPNFEWTALPEEQRFVIRARTQCNWVQALEGVVDSAHIMFLHGDVFRPHWADELDQASASAAARPDDPNPGNGDGNLQYGHGDKFSTSISQDLAPKLYVETTPYGFRYAAVRKTPSADTRYVRTSHFVAPFYGFFPGPAGWGFMQAFVPVDDYTTIFYWWQYRVDGQPIDQATREAACKSAGLVPGVDVDEQGRCVRTPANLWLQDRAAMERRETFSGIPGFQNEDFAVQESMGPLFDRSREHLGRSDVAVVRMRRVMLDLVENLSAGRESPGHDFDLARIRPGEAVIPADEPWQKVGDWLDRVSS